MAASGGAWTHPVLRRAHEPTCAAHISVPSGAALASRAVAAKSERPRPLGPHAAPHRSLAATAFRLSSLSPAPHGRRYLSPDPWSGLWPIMIPTPTGTCRREVACFPNDCNEVRLKLGSSLTQDGL